ncbi:MAG: IPT/TIG domain-containing protein, partial [Dehalococcoidales bacterium]|nr:IPT/TIG domain-containing protein [Dehalococcoidales bacterium]
MRKIVKLISIILVLELVLCLANVVPVLAGPDADIDLSKSSGTAGSEITIEGFDYDEYESILVTFGDDEEEWDEEADDDGDWEVDIEIPEVPYGTYTITVTGEGSPTITKNFRVLPGIVLERTSGKPGDAITVSGTGFREDEEGIEVTFNGEIMEDDIDADEWGSWECELVVPGGLTPGRYEVDAYGDDTRASSVDNVSFTLAAGTGITLSRTSGAVGTAITVTGTGFTANESDIRITYDGAVTGSTIRANSSGAWALTFTIPESTSGSHIFDASGSSTSTSSVPDQNFNVIPSFSLNPTSAPAGGIVNVKGSGFAADETGITMTYDGSPIGQVVRANSRGGWTTSFTVPSSATGSHIIDAYGDETSASYTNNVNFIVGAGIVLNKYSGTSETAVNVTGSGFSAREQGIEVLFSGTQVAGGITASETGTWSASFNVPNLSSGEYIVDARGSITQPATIPDITYTVTPGISLSQSSGSAGTALTITGTGFASNERGISISFDDSEVSSGINADAGGKWTTIFSVPPSVAGSHSIRIKGAATDTSTTGNLS